jgi:uncharacterized membrane protein
MPPARSGSLASNVATFGGPAALASPPIEPTVGGAYAHGWRVLKRCFWRLLLIGAVAWLISAAGSAALNRVGTAGGLLSFVFQFLVITPLSYGVAWAFLRAARGEQPALADQFVVFRKNYAGAVLAGFLSTLAILIGFVLLVVPGIVLAVRLAFVPFVVVDAGQGGLDALRASWRRTSGYSWRVLGVSVLGIVAAIVGLLLLVIGVIPASILVYLAFASLYVAITARVQPAEPASPVTPYAVDD